MDIGKRIKELRKERNLTQKQFGQLVHKSSQVVSNWERGYTTGITAEDLQAIAHAFGIPEGEILNDGTSAEPPSGLTARDERDIEHFDLATYIQNHDALRYDGSTYRLNDEDRKALDTVVRLALRNVPANE